MNEMIAPERMLGESGLIPAGAQHSITVDDVQKKYKLDKIWVEALKGISCKIEAGQMTFVVGPSGSGKSTLLNLLGLIDRPTSGKIEILGEDTSKMSDAAASDFRARHIGFIFQSFNLLPVLSLRENVELSLMRSGLSQRVRRARVDQYLEAVGLSEFVNRRPGEISGGQRQRVAIARALASEPDIVIADEPTANLDTNTSAEIVELLHRMRRELGASIILCTHDNELIVPGARQIRIIDGKLANQETV